jgi:tripartite-type tricarboxylate transporter receptor subunit TctC
MEDLQPVAMGAVGQMAIVTGSRVPMTTVEDVLREARSQTLFYGTTGVGSITHFGAELLSSVADIQMEPVHYSGGTDALVDLAGGRIDLYVGTVTQVMSSIQSGMATPVAVISASRSSALPDVPTIGEAGVPGAEADVWWGVFTADGTPPEVVQALNDAINGLMSRPAAAEFLAPFGAQPSPMSVEDFEAWVQGEFDNWSRLAELNNMVMD